ncbi:MAG: hypothetical protein EXS52_00770 [Candidatus Staskawiczbacteria bacterium]|nr:hypothetical protein [Candidatus Staskawiczbacteria bacterium]
MEIKKVKLSRLKESHIRHNTLPDELIRRIKAYKEILGMVENTSPNETVINFKRDLYPEEEIRIWEKISNQYKSFIAKNKITDLDAQKEVFKVILTTSLGTN